MAQLVAMLFCQLGGAKSRREITVGLQASEGKLRDLGLPEALGRGQGGAMLGLPGKLLSLDATVIDLCAAVFDWAQFRTTKGAVKLHLLLDHDGYLPCYAAIAEGNVHEIRVARKLHFQRGTMLVFESDSQGMKPEASVAQTCRRPKRSSFPSSIRSRAAIDIESISHIF